jgi:hypothetical protein
MGNTQRKERRELKRLYDVTNQPWYVLPPVKVELLYLVDGNRRQGLSEYESGMLDLAEYSYNYNVSFWHVDVPVPLNEMTRIAICDNHVIFIDRNNHLTLINRDCERIWSTIDEKWTHDLDLRVGYEFVTIWEEGGILKIDDQVSFRAFHLSTRKWIWNINWDQYTPLGDFEKNKETYPIDNTHLINCWIPKNLSDGGVVIQLIDYSRPEKFVSEILLPDVHCIWSEVEHGILWYCDHKYRLFQWFIKERRVLRSCESVLVNPPSQILIFSKWIFLRDKTTGRILVINKDTMESCPKETFFMNNSILNGEKEQLSSVRIDFEIVGVYLLLRIRRNLIVTTNLYDSKCRLFRSMVSGAMDPPRFGGEMTRRFWIWKDRVGCIFNGQFFYGYYGRNNRLGYDSMFETPTDVTFTFITIPDWEPNFEDL